MCKMLDRLAGKTAAELLIEAGVFDTIPIDLEKLLAYWSISVMPISFKKLQESEELRNQVEEKGYILGAVALKGDNLCIFYNQDDSPNRQRFTIANKLAHCCLDYKKLANEEINFRYDKPAPEDISFNTFAGEILIPEKSVREIYKKLIYPSVGDLAMIFNVSENVMTERLKVLDLAI